MRRLPILPVVLLSTLILALPPALGACAGADEPTPDGPQLRADEPLVGASYEITTAAALSQEQIQAIAQFTQGQGQDVQQARVQVELSDEGEGTTISIELWGAGLPGEDFAAALQQEFAFLAEAQVGYAALDGEPELPAAAVEIEGEDDPEVIKQKIIDDLRAKGVTGEIEVTVTPTADGHHAIEVEVHDEQTKAE